VRIVRTGLGTLRTDTNRAIDEAAEALRASFITLGAGQALVYEQKLREAEAVLAATHWNAELGEDVTELTAAAVPNIAAEADDLGISLFAASVVVAQNAAAWAQISAGIERLRLGAKRAVQAADNADDIRAAAQIDWSAALPTQSS
jgi:hypothetical protein